MTAIPPAAKQNGPRSNEKHVTEVRRHWINLVWRAWLPGGLTVLCWAGSLLAFRNVSGTTPDSNVLLGLGLLALSLAPILWVSFVYYDWANDYLAITKMHLVHYEQRYFLSRRTQVVPLQQVQNVRIRIPNVLLGRLDVGDLLIETTSPEGTIHFRSVQDPQNVQRQLFTLLGRPMPARAAQAPVREPPAEPLQARRQRSKIYALWKRPAPTEEVERPSTWLERLAFSLERTLPTYPIQTANGEMTWHRHPSILVWRMMVPNVLFALSWLGALLALLGQGGATPDLRLTIGLILLSLIPAGWGLVVYYDWRNDYLTIDQDQIVHYEQHYIFRRETRAIPLQRVQNVRIYIPHVIARWLNVGEVIIDTAGQRGDITFNGVKNPQQIQNRIFVLRGRPEPTEVTEPPKHPLARFFDQFLPIYPVRTPEGWIIYHRHPFVLLQRIFWPLGLLVATWLPAFWLLSTGMAGALPAIGMVAIPILALCGVGALLWLWYTYADWKNDYWIVTDTHVIDVIARPFPYMSEDRRQARLQDIVNIRTEVPGIWAQIIRMGDVFAETAGQAENFVLQQMVNPKSVQVEMQRRQRTARVREQQAAEEARLAEQARLQGQILETVGQAQRVAQEEFERRVLEILEQRTGQSKTPSHK